MKRIAQFFLVMALALLAGPGISQTSDLTVRISVSGEVQEQFQENGRMYIFLTQNSQIEPYTQTWPNPFAPTHIMAKNLQGIKTAGTYTISDMTGWISTSDWNLDNVPNGTYYIQALWDQDEEESRISAPGNLYSPKQEVTLNGNSTIELTLSQVIGPRKLADHKLIRYEEFRSQSLSDWWNKDVYLKVAILLPHGYEPGNPYAIRYNVAGYGGRYTRVNYLINDNEFMQWWESGDAPQVINVFLDGEGPFGDSYQMDSENSGPYGHALINELIPYLENKYRGTTDASTRFVDGCSTGGWVSLGLQLYYPDVFGHVYSFSPDAIEFTNYQLINIYEDNNAYINEFGYERPVMRNVMGEPMLSLRDFITYENVLSTTNTYVRSGGQFSAHTALYSPKGDDGLPKPLFDPQTGEIDHEVAEHWKKYDLKLYAEKNWETLGPKIQGKIYIWMGDMDQFYLNTGTRAFGEFIQKTEAPESDAVIEFEPMKGHCQGYNYGITLHMIQKDLEN